MGGTLLDIAGTLKLLHSSHVRERDKALLRSVMVGENAFSLERVRGLPVPCRFCGDPDGDGHLFGECSYLLLLRSVKRVYCGFILGQRLLPPLRLLGFVSPSWTWVEFSKVVWLKPVEVFCSVPGPLRVFSCSAGFHCCPPGS